MSKVRWAVGGLLLGSSLIFGLTNVAVYAEKAITKKSAKPNMVYQEECGACHRLIRRDFYPQKAG